MQNAMEQSKILMWTRRKSIRQTHPPVFSSAPPSAASHGHSWEEQAFAEDSAGRFGGCVWPPRSYSCSFCLREFRSAQALGGHMNVHRRDRARLKTTPTSSLEGTRQLSLPDPRCLPSAAPNPRAGHGTASSPLSSSRVSVSSSQKNSLEQTQAFPSDFSAPFVKEYREACPLSTALLISSDHQFSLRLPIASKLKQRGADLPLIVEMNHGEEREAEEEDEDDARPKRRRVDVAIPFIISSFQGEETTLQSKVADLPPSPMVELDLELRL